MALVFANMRNFILPRKVAKYRFPCIISIQEKYDEIHFLRTNFQFHFSPLYLILFICFAKSFNYYGIVLQSRNDDRENFHFHSTSLFRLENFYSLIFSSLFIQISSSLYTFISSYLIKSLYPPISLSIHLPIPPFLHLPNFPSLLHSICHPSIS